MTDLAQLADRLVLVVEREGPASGTALAETVGVRKQTVLAVLHADDRFVCSGGSRWQVWSLAATGNRGNRKGTARNQKPTEADCEPWADVLDRLTAIEWRLAALEDRRARLAQTNGRPA